MISTNDARPGMALDLPEGLFSVIEYQHVKPGKGKAFVRMKLKNLDSGALIDRTFRAGENVEQAVIDRREHQFLYRDDLGYHFMDLETYAQFALNEDQVGDAASFLVDGLTAILPMYRDVPIAVELPASVEMEVVEAEPGVKGDRVSGATKPVTVSTGLVVHVPLFVGEGDHIKVDTRTGSYITRV
ncbi:elongation factor P [bacterium BMS3Abin02]|nr:elongation factor P [bacterium BMS3Abin02]GBE21377.1 elongation factor P [bacterium BMS3Bbin01]HDH25702.1 elongation factor P [Actinomycetota bacterium]HDK45540.1 elongation factor P [Actinomycetota bacterium]HDL48741.1 elongation factor P [Actinomycetota bacterium]